MKVKALVISVLLCFVLILAGCGGADSKDSADSSNSAQNENSAPSASTEGETGNEQSNSDGDLETISQLSDVWMSLYKQNEPAINAYEGMPVMELLGPDAFFIGGVQYDGLNPNNSKGRFEGELILAGWPAFIEKSGDTITFGYDTIRKEDGVSPSAKAGDRVVENGTFDTSAEYLVSEEFVERAGEKVERSYYEFKRLSDGSMISIAFDGDLYDFRDDKNPRNDAVYIKASKDSYEFVVAKAKTGPGFQIVSFADKGDMTKDQAIATFTEAGYTIDKTGGVKDGVFYLD